MDSDMAIGLGCLGTVFFLTILLGLQIQISVLKRRFEHLLVMVGEKQREGNA